MLAAPLNDEDCLSLMMPHAVAAIARADVRELAARLRTIAAVVRYLRRMPQRDDGPDDRTKGPRVACDVPQRVRVPAPDPNCVERALLYLALAELIAPWGVRYLATIELDGPSGRVRHTFPVEDGEPVSLDPDVAPPHTLAAGLHLMRNASGDVGAPLSRLGSLRWAVDLAGDLVKRGGGVDALRHSRAVRDVERIARGMLPVEPATLAWALRVAVPAVVPFGPEGTLALEAAAALLDELGTATAPGGSAQVTDHR